LQASGIAMIFQDALTSLNPGLTVGFQIAELFRLHRGDNRTDARNHAIRLLERVGIPSPETRVDQYPHQFSGGMNQRIMIAMAVALKPRILIADEPTTALDVTIQAQILDLMKELQAETGMAIMLITHDLGVVSEASDRVAVMYGGRIVEIGATKRTLTHPVHPYTKGLKRSAPSANGGRGRLEAIPGVAPHLMSLPRGCVFAPRCPVAFSLCRTTTPPNIILDDGQEALCHLLLE
jgi:oligopeptide transport system ATP-binding protein